MRLNRVTIQEWHTFQRVDVDLSRVHVASVIGRMLNAPERSNGAGKSYFLEAPLYAIFGHDRDPAAAQRLKAEDDTFVEVWFTHRGREARVKRGFRRRKDGKPGDGFLEFDLDGQPQGEKIRELDDEIVKHVGCGLDLYLATCFFSQGAADRFVRSAAGERRRILSDLLGMAVYEAARRISEAEAQRSRDVIESHSRDRDEERIKRDAVGVSATRFEGRNLPLLREKAEGRIARLDELLRDGPESLAGQRALVIDVPLRAAELSDALSQAEAMRARVRSTEAATAAARQRMEARRKNLEAEHRERIGRAKGIPARQKLVEELVERARLSKAEVEMSPPEDPGPIALAAQDASGRAAVANAEARRLAESILALDRLQAMCPTCGQAVPESHREQHRLQYETQRSDALARAAAAAQEVRDASARIEGIRASRERLRAVREQGVSLEATLQVESARLTDDLAAQARESEAAAASRTELEGYDAEVTRMSDQESADRSALAAWDARAEERRVAYESVRQAIDVDAEKAVLRLEFAIKSRLAEQRGIRDQIVLDEEILRGLTERLVEYQRRFDELDRSVKAAERDLRVRGFLSEAFSRGGIPALVMENVVSEIERGTVRILEAMESPFRIQFRTENNWGSDTIQIDVETPDGMRGVKSFSGGQITEINLAVRLSLAEVMSRRADVSFDSIYLDEVMGGLDAPARDCFLRVVNMVRRSFQQVFVISHDSRIRDVLESSVVVTWTPEGSAVEVSE